MRKKTRGILAKMTITVVDGSGREVDLEPYRSRIVIPEKRKEEIREWVAAKEQELEGSQSDGQCYKYKDPAEIVPSFLRCATYTENLLDSPFQASENTLQKVADYCNFLLPLEMRQYFGAMPHFEQMYRNINPPMYHIEKAKRIGVDVALSESDKKTIKILEEELFKTGGENHARLVKMLGRHKALGLSEPEEEIRKSLGPIPSSFIFWDWLGCAALRAGLRLSPVYSWQLDQKISTQVEQKSREEFDLDLYISGMHHLHRLLNPE